MLITLECSATLDRRTEAEQTSEKRADTPWFPLLVRKVQSLVIVAVRTDVLGTANMTMLPRRRSDAPPPFDSRSHAPEIVSRISPRV
jgi:hypothetical protein